MIYCEIDPEEHILRHIMRNSEVFIDENAFENIVFEMAAIMSHSTSMC